MDPNTMPLDQLEQLVLSKAAAVGAMAGAAAGPPPPAGEPAPAMPMEGEPPMPEGPMGFDEALAKGVEGMPEMEAPPEVVQAGTAALVAAGLLQAPSDIITPEVLAALDAWNAQTGGTYNVDSRESVIAMLEDLANGAG